MIVYTTLFIISCSQPKEELSGSQVYSLYCVHCHQENGEGVKKRYPPLAGSKWLTGAMDLGQWSPKRRTFDAVDPARLPTPAPVETVV